MLINELDSQARHQALVALCQTRRQLSLLEPAAIEPIALLFQEPPCSQGLHTHHKLSAPPVTLLLREDRRHPIISGNKWHKLKYNLLQAYHDNQTRLVSFGGACSNHLHALAKAGELFGFETIGIVRGERPKHLSPTLVDAQQWGMTLQFVSRQQYRRLTMSDPSEVLAQPFGDCCLIPEGGSNELGLIGCMDWAEEIVNTLQKQQLTPTVLTVATATGTTLAGLVLGLQRCYRLSIRCMGVSVLKAEDYPDRAIASYLAQYSPVAQQYSPVAQQYSPVAHASAPTPVDRREPPRWQVLHDYHQGGYAKSSVALRTYMDAFTDHTGLPLDPVYMGKHCFALNDLRNKGEIDNADTVLIIHSGGLQGARGLTA